MLHKKIKLLLPFALFIILAFFLWKGLQIDPHRVPSVLINKPLPTFNLTTVASSKATLTEKDFLGQVSILNVWASWCYTCRYEHQVWMEISHNSAVKIYGFNYKDQRADAQEWLRVGGDPYLASGFDQNGKVAIDLGVYGTPETFIIDKQGVIRYKHVGAINPQIWQEQLLPLIKQLENAQ